MSAVEQGIYYRNQSSHSCWRKGEAVAWVKELACAGNREAVHVRLLEQGCEGVDMEGRCRFVSMSAQRSTW